MSPTALATAEGHHDSFSLPAQDQSKVHPSARRAPAGGLVKVDSDSTVYVEGGIKAKFTDRGANVVSE
jgi:myo-inositol-1-phosphate synthase